MKCPHCGSEHIVCKTAVCQQNDVSPIGLRYRKAKIFYGAEQIYADLCGDCGTIIRQYVTDMSRDWDLGKGEKKAL